MDKYRIIKILYNGKIHYEVQKHITFFFWQTEKYFDCCIDGLMAGNYPIEFKSIKEAKIFIKRQNVKKEIIC